MIFEKLEKIPPTKSGSRLIRGGVFSNIPPDIENISSFFFKMKSWRSGFPIPISLCQIYIPDSRHSFVSITLRNEPLTKAFDRSSRGIDKMSSEKRALVTENDANEVIL